MLANAMTAIILMYKIVKPLPMPNISGRGRVESILTVHSGKGCSTLPPIKYCEGPCVSCAQLQVGEEEHEHDHQGEKSSGGEEAGNHHHEGAEQNRT